VDDESVRAANTLPKPSAALDVETPGQRGAAVRLSGMGLVHPEKDWRPRVLADFRLVTV